MIENLLIHVDNESTFASMNVSANDSNSSWSKGGVGTPTTEGNLDIKWNSIVFIKESGRIWTHGQSYGNMYPIPKGNIITNEELQALNDAMAAGRIPCHINDYTDGDSDLLVHLISCDHIYFLDVWEVRFNRIITVPNSNHLSVWYYQYTLNSDNLTYSLVISNENIDLSFLTLDLIGNSGTISSTSELNREFIKTSVGIFPKLTNSDEILENKGSNGAGIPEFCIYETLFDPTKNSWSKQLVLFAFNGLNWTRYNWDTITLDTSGDGTYFLSDDGSYKHINTDSDILIIDPNEYTSALQIVRLLKDNTKPLYLTNIHNYTIDNDSTIYKRIIPAIFSHSDSESFTINYMFDASTLFESKQIIGRIEGNGGGGISHTYDTINLTEDSNLLELNTYLINSSGEVSSTDYGTIINAIENNYSITYNGIQCQLSIGDSGITGNTLVMSEYNNDADRTTVYYTYNIIIWPDYIYLIEKSNRDQKALKVFPIIFSGTYSLSENSGTLTLDQYEDFTPNIVRIEHNILCLGYYHPLTYVSSNILDGVTYYHYFVKIENVYWYLEVGSDYSYKITKSPLGIKSTLITLDTNTYYFYSDKNLIESLHGQHLYVNDPINDYGAELGAGIYRILQNVGTSTASILQDVCILIKYGNSQAYNIKLIPLNPNKYAFVVGRSYYLGDSDKNGDMSYLDIFLVSGSDIVKSASKHPNVKDELNFLISNKVFYSKYIDSTDYTKNIEDMICENITYTNLLNKANNYALIPGLKYKITDYSCTTTLTNTSAVFKSLDIIVTAISLNSIDEEAVTYHGSDRYKVWYSLQNDKSRFAWADVLNGKGVIYRMIDKWGNDCPYDFLNIQFLRNTANTSADWISLVGIDSKYYYTFSWVDTLGRIEDIRTKSLYYDTSKTKILRTLNNVIKPCRGAEMGYYDSEYALPNNVFIYTENSSNGIYYGIRFNTIDEGSVNNSFLNNNYHNHLGLGCSNNIFYSSCTNLTLGDLCLNNTFHDNCIWTILDKNCLHNVLYGARNCYLESGVTYTQLYNEDGDFVYNTRVCSGVNGNSSNRVSPNVNNQSDGNSSQLIITKDSLGETISIRLAGQPINVTYSYLLNLRNQNKLTPGQTYVITDYLCTTTAEGTLSAGHQFDIIVTALSNESLSEEAKACRHAGDTYFTDTEVEAWKLWYTLDNDSTRFTWADSSNGKGVIYRMIDQAGNDVPYDFKNIQYLGSYVSSHLDANIYHYTFDGGEFDYSKGSVDNCHANNIITPYVVSNSAPDDRALNYIVLYGDNPNLCLNNIFDRCNNIEGSYYNCHFKNCNNIDCDEGIGGSNCNFNRVSPYTLSSNISNQTIVKDSKNIILTYGTGDNIFKLTTASSANLKIYPNTYYKFGTVSGLTITFLTEYPNIYNEYMFEFTASSSGTTLTLPSTIKWMDGEAIIIEAGKTYQISIVNNLAIYGSF